MKNGCIVNKCQSPYFKLGTGLVLTLIALFLFGGFIGCGSSKRPTAPTALIKDYISKHETMVDPTLVDLYVEVEQSKVAQLIDQSIAARKSEGSLESLQHATFDFTGLTVELLDEKQDYVNDEPKTFIKVATKGSFTMSLDEGSKTIPLDSIVILEKEGADWKITETLNPWG